MMAKMFYTLEETKSALGKSEDEVKQFAREGRLREFRDGPRLMFKADQVDQLKSDLGSGTVRSDIGPSDSGSPIGLADPSGASGSGVISLADTDFGKSPGAGMVKEDTALAADLGLSGSMGGVPSPSRSGTGAGSGSMSGSRGTGITVFDVDDSQKADPMAQTAIGSGIQDQVNLEGVGSGSGLLDLTRESDDTSLGAELLDEIAPGGSGAATMRRPAQSDSGVGMDQLAGGSVVNRSRLAQPVYVEAADPLAGAFGGLALFGAICVLFGGFVVANAVFGVHPDLVKDLAPGPQSKGLLYLAGAGIGAILFFAVGWFIGKGASSSSR